MKVHRVCTGCASVTSRCIRSIRFRPNLLGDIVLHKAGESRACVPMHAHDPRGGAVHKGIPAVIPLNRDLKSMTITMSMRESECTGFDFH